MKEFNLLMKDGLKTAEVHCNQPSIGAIQGGASTQSEKTPEHIARRISILEQQQERLDVLKKYLITSFYAGDMHSVRDAAVDIEVLETEMRVRKQCSNV